MNVIVTCGPSFEPIDEVRRITNFSTGELGVVLAEELARAGHRVFCLKGSAATHPNPIKRCFTLRFDTNDDLLNLLRKLGASESIGAVFHAAALCDYRVKQIQNAAKQTVSSPKIESRTGDLTLTLETATKVIAELRSLFPKSALVGWKYELAGTRKQALERAKSQIQQCHTDACILNGRAWGSGFAFIPSAGRSETLTSKTELANFLVSWLDKCKGC